MKKRILITGATDGLGLLTAQLLARQGHDVLIHGRSADKLERVVEEIDRLGDGVVEGHLADLSRRVDIEALAGAMGDVALDVLINNAGVFATTEPRTPGGLDLRFVVNTIAPYVLTQRLLGGALGAGARVLNLSSAAQAPVSLEALQGRVSLSQGAAYAQSKLALTMWTRRVAQKQAPDGPMLVSVNPGSMLGTKMVREGFGVSGHDPNIGASILARLALEVPMPMVSGAYYDNDARRVGVLHPDALDEAKCDALIEGIQVAYERMSS